MVKDTDKDLKYHVNILTVSQSRLFSSCHDKAPGLGAKKNKSPNQIWKHDKSIPAGSKKPINANRSTSMYAPCTYANL
jgi:hypothetical protein